MPSLYILDVGHGNSSVLFDRGGVAIFDAGPGDCLLAFLKNHKVSTVEYVILSHADKDHIAGLIGLLSQSQIKIGCVYLNSDSTKKKSETFGVLWENLLRALQDHHKRTDGNIDKFKLGVTPQINEEINIGDVGVEVIAPSQMFAGLGAGSVDRRGREISSNSLSAVIKIIYKKTAVALLPGDIDMVGLEYLLDEHPNLEVWMAVFPHHGGRPGAGSVEGFTRLFSNVTKPKYMVFSVGKNQDKFPRPEVLTTVESLLGEVCFMTTGFSGAMERHIENSKNKTHRNCVSTVCVEFLSSGPKIVV